MEKQKSAIFWLECLLPEIPSGEFKMAFKFETPTAITKRQDYDGYSILTAYSNPQSYVLRRKHRFLKAYKGHTSAMISLIISVRHRKLESLPSTRKDIWVFPYVCSSA